MTHDDHLLMALGNLAVCTGIGWVCVMRMAVMSSATRWFFRLNMALLLVAATASAFQPALFGEFPGWADLIVNAALLVYVGSGMRRWRHCPPPYAQKPERLEPIEPSQWRHVPGGKQ